MKEIYYLAIVIFVCYGFVLAQGLRAAINRNETVRLVPKFLCSVYCLSASIIGIYIIPWTYGRYPFPDELRSFIFFHLFIIVFQLAMIWFPKPKE